MQFAVKPKKRTSDERSPTVRAVLKGLLCRDFGLRYLKAHSVPYFGTHPLVEPHSLSRRGRRQPSILPFLAQEAESKVFCSSNAALRKGERAGAIFGFIDFWTRQHGRPPQ